MFNCWPLEEQHYAEGFAVSASVKTDDPPLWSGLLTPSARAAALRENRGHCLNCHEDTHPLRNCRHPFINASGCLNLELGRLGDDDVFRRWQARMVSYRRDGRSSRSQTCNKNHRNRSNQSRAYHQDQGQINSHSGNHNNSYTPGQHGAVPPSPASSASASALGTQLGATQNPSGNPNAPTRYLSHRQLTARWRYGTPDPYADGTVGNTSFGFAKCSSACCSPYAWRGTNNCC